MFLSRSFKGYDWRTSECIPDFIETMEDIDRRHSVDIDDMLEELEAFHKGRFVQGVATGALDGSERSYENDLSTAIWGIGSLGYDTEKIYEFKRKAPDAFYDSKLYEFIQFDLVDYMFNQHLYEEIYNLRIKLFDREELLDEHGISY